MAEPGSWLGCLAPDVPAPTTTIGCLQHHVHAASSASPAGRASSSRGCCVSTDSVHPSRKPFWISAPFALPGCPNTWSPGGGEVGAGGSGLTAVRGGEAGFWGVLACVCLGGAGLTPPPEPHLELAPKVGHLVQPMLLYAPAAAPLARVSTSFRFYLRGGADARVSGPGQLREGGADPTPEPQHEHPSGTPALLLPGLSPSGPSYGKPSQTTPTLGSTPLWALPAPWTPHSSPLWVVTVTSAVCLPALGCEPRAGRTRVV